MRQGLFEVFGTGSLGLKADDLNSFASELIEAGLSVPEGIVIATDIFNQAVATFEHDKGGMPKWSSNCPEFLRFTLTEILSSMTKGTPYVIRSSALSERGGTGIYESTFLSQLETKETQIIFGKRFVSFTRANSLKMLKSGVKNKTRQLEWPF